MPRKLRIEYAGATYHIISRGNYRKDLFVQKRSGEAFERTIYQRLRRETTAGNPWIANRLRMGSPNYVSNLIHA